MPEYIDPDVAELRESDSDERVTLLVGVSGDRDDFRAKIVERGASVDDTLGQATLRVTAPKSLINELCEIDGLTSVELERDDVRILDQGNGRSRQRVTR